MKTVHFQLDMQYDIFLVIINGESWLCRLDNRIESNSIPHWTSVWDLWGKWLMGYCFSKNIFPLFVLPFVFPFVFIVSTIAQSWGQQEIQFVPYGDFSFFFKPWFARSPYRVFCCPLFSKFASSPVSAAVLERVVCIASLVGMFFLFFWQGAELAS